MTRLSGPQLNRLRYANKQQLFTTGINRGNERLLDWDPLLRGRVVVTVLGAQRLKEELEQEWAADWYWHIFGGAPGPHERTKLPRKKAPSP